MNGCAGLLDVDWPAPARVRAGFSTRRGGHSLPPWNSLNLATHVGDDPGTVARNRALLARRCGFASEPYWLQQVHGNRVVRIEDDAADRRADAAITAVPGRILTVMVADCLPLLLCERQGREVAAVHAGWRGLEAQVIARTLVAFGADASEVLAWIGPAIGATRYTVGSELYQRFIAADPGNGAAFGPAPAAQWQMDLVALASRQLAAAGVASISVSSYCVYEHADLFFSHRRDGVTGRTAAFIWLQDE